LYILIPPQQRNFLFGWTIRRIEVEGVVNIGKLFCIYLHSGLISIVTYHTFLFISTTTFFLSARCFVQWSRSVQIVPSRWVGIYSDLEETMYYCRQFLLCLLPSVVRVLRTTIPAPILWRKSQSPEYLFNPNSTKEVGNTGLQQKMGEMLVMRIGFFFWFCNQMYQTDRHGYNPRYLTSSIQTHLMSVVYLYISVRE
jgi:hypothetical protein